MNQKVEVTATKSKDEGWRIDRLNQFLGYLQGYHAALLGKDGFDFPFARVHDHKGALQVFWLSVPDKEGSRIVEMAWEAMGELRENVVHFYTAEWTREN